MRKIKVQPLTQSDFAPFGSFASVFEPEGKALCGELHSFYRDSSRFFYDGTAPIGFSPMTVKKPGSMVIKCAEYHNHTCEAIMSVNDDFVLHVAPANTGTPDPAGTKAFLVPKGVIVTLYPGVWHLCPLPKSEPVLNVLIILPERTYLNDIVVENFAEEDFFEIEL